MAITQVRAQFNGQWYMLTYNEDARAYQTTITPDTFSGGQPDGYYDVTVEATNDSGVVVTTDGDNLLGLRLVVRETIQPILTLVSPEAGYVTTNTPAVTWTAQDNDGGSGIDPDSAMVKLDGKAVPAEQVSVTAGAGGTYTITYTPGAALAEGPHTVQAGISDNDGNTATMEANYIVDTVPPALSALLPFEEVVVDPYTVTITGQTNDATAPPVTMTVMDNGAVAGHPTVGPDGRFSFLLNLEVGENNVTVVAKDGAGLTTTASYTSSAWLPTGHRPMWTPRTTVGHTTPLISTGSIQPWPIWTGGFRRLDTSPDMPTRILPGLWMTFRYRHRWRTTCPTWGRSVARSPLPTPQQSRPRWSS